MALNTGYAAIKTHFDRLFNNMAFPIDFDHTRSVYSNAFNIPTAAYPMYAQPLKVMNNPINRIVTFAVNKSLDVDKVPYGIMPSINGIDYIHILDYEFGNGITEKNLENYIRHVYRYISDIVSYDKFADADGRTPYGIFLRACPIYFTYHHIDSVAGNIASEMSLPIFNNFADEIVKNENDIEALLESISSTTYNPTFESICSVVTCKNTIELY